MTPQEHHHLSLQLSSRFALFVRIVRLGVSNILAHQLRSVLTALGIIFGVASVISMLAIGEGASQEVQDQIRRLGSQNIILRSVKPPQSPDQEETSGMVLEYGLTYADAERLHDTLPSARVLIPTKIQREDMWHRDRKVTANLVGTAPWFPDAQPIEIERGRFLAPLDMEQRLNVCVLGSGLAENLFRFEDPLGQPVKLGSDTYRIVGIVRHESGAQGNGTGSNLAGQIGDCFIPLTTLRSRVGDMVVRRQSGSISAEKIELSELIVEVSNREAVITTASIIERLVAERHKKKDYELIVPLRLLEEARKTQRIFSIVLGLIGAISLLVGGIGIMNIMLATVSERTREIGIRRAIGARRRDILTQFLIETTILSVGGGLLGMALGAAIPWAVTKFSGLPTVLTFSAFALSFVISLAVGLVFGLYPARRAAMMDPIDALRYE